MEETGQDSGTRKLARYFTPQQYEHIRGLMQRIGEGDSTAVGEFRSFTDDYLMKTSQRLLAKYAPAHAGDEVIARKYLDAVLDNLLSDTTNTHYFNSKGTSWGSFGQAVQTNLADKYKRLAPTESREDEIRRLVAEGRIETTRIKPKKFDFDMDRGSDNANHPHHLRTAADNIDPTFDAVAAKETSAALFPGDQDITPGYNKAVIKARFVDGMSQIETANELGVTREWSRQLEHDAIAKLRNGTHLSRISLAHLGVDMAVDKKKIGDCRSKIFQAFGGISPDQLAEKTGLDEITTGLILSSNIWDTKHHCQKLLLNRSDITEKLVNAVIKEEEKKGNDPTSAKNEMIATLSTFFQQVKNCEFALQQEKCLRF